MAEAVEKAYRAIRDGIMRGAYQQGAHLTAQELAANTGVSRTPVREAMRRLHAEGLIRIIPNRGAFVSDWSENEVEQIYELRVLLESHAAAQAATRASQAHIDRLRRLADEMYDLAATDSPPLGAIAQINDAFHKTLIDAAGNGRLKDLLSSIVEVPLVLSTFRHYQPDELLRSATQHKELVSAVAARDASWARSVMAAHILSARHTLLRSLQAHDINGPLSEAR